MMPILALENISLSVDNLEKPILSNINIKVYPSDFIILLGSNGSGKSSLLKLIDQRYQPTQGKMIFADDLNKNISRIKTITQNCNESLFTSLTVIENYLLIRQFHENNLFNLSAKLEREFFAEYLISFNPNLSDKLNQTVDKLSGGEKQALVLALTMLYPPRILLLDEHTSALDPKSADQLMQLTDTMVKIHKMTCLLATHDLDIAHHYGNRIVVLRNGNLLQSIEHEEKRKLNQAALLAACY